MDITSLIQNPAPWLVALNTLLHELGAPLPLTPTVLLAGAASVDGGAHPATLIAIVVAGMLAANSAWFAAGRRYGSGVLKFLCRISLSPDSCVRKTEDSFGRWGAYSLVVGRFIPGVSLVAPPLAGALGMRWTRFIVLSTISAALWALLVVGAGMLLHAQLDVVVLWLGAFGRETFATIVVLLAGYVAWRWWQRRRMARKLNVPRMTVVELKTLMDRGEAPLVIDVRGATLRQVDPRHIPMALALDPSTIEAGQTDFPRERQIVLYCDCPNEASAAHLARLLIERGHLRTQALLGGLEAWTVAGFGVEVEPSPAAEQVAADLLPQ